MLTPNLIERIDSFGEVVAGNSILQHMLLKEIVYNRDIEALNYYLSKGYDINVRNAQFKTVAFHLHEANLEMTDALVQNGLDLKVIDIYGNTILYDILYGAEVETIRTVLSAGVDPYKKNFIGEHALYAAEKERSFYEYRNGVSIDLFKEYIQVDRIGLVSYKEAILDGNFSLALTIVKDELNALGGFTSLFSHRSLDVFRFVTRLYNALVLNKQYSEANFLLQANFIEDSIYLHLPASYCPVGIEPILLLNDGDNLERFYEFYKDKLESIPKSVFEFVTYVVSKIMDCPDYIGDNLENIGKSQIQEASDFVWEFFDLIDEDSTSNKLELLQNMIDFTENQSISFNKRVQYLQLIGFYYVYRKDWLNAEYQFNEIVKLSNLFSEIPNELYSAYVMIDYISQKREG